MDIVNNYVEFDRLPKKEGREVLVLTTNFRYRMINGHWECVGSGPLRRRSRRSTLAKPYITSLNSYLAFSLGFPNILRS